MKTKFVIISLLFIFQNIFSQNITGSWYGNLDIQGQKLPLTLHIEKDGSDLKSTFDSPTQGAIGIPIQKTIFENNELSFDAADLGITFNGKLNVEKIEGNFKQRGMNFPLILTRNEETTVLNRPQTPKPPFNYDIEEVQFINSADKNTLAGTISQPKNFDKNKPVLVMITGSGVQNRDEELFGHKPFAVIADDFAQKGIATLRLDDRGIGGSTKGKETDNSSNFATDINSAVDFLVKKGYKNTGLIGHSEGGMIAPMVADKNKNVRFLVLMAAPGIATTDLLQKQSYDIAKISGAPENILRTNESTNQKIYDFIIQYKGNNLQTDLKSLFIAELKKLPKDQISPENISEKAEE